MGFLASLSQDNSESKLQEMAGDSSLRPVRTIQKVNCRKWREIPRFARNDRMPGGRWGRGGDSQEKLIPTINSNANRRLFP